MQQTTNYQLKKPEANDYYNVADQNANMDAIDTALMAKFDKSGGSVTGNVSVTGDLTASTLTAADVTATDLTADTLEADTLTATDLETENLTATDVTATDLTATNLTANALTAAGGTVTGTLILSKTADASGTEYNAPALIVGGTAIQQHIEIDGNEIMAKSGETGTSTLSLNYDGGKVSIGPGGLEVGGAVTAGGYPVGRKLLWESQDGVQTPCTLNAPGLSKYMLFRVSFSGLAAAAICTSYGSNFRGTNVSLSEQYYNPYTVYINGTIDGDELEITMTKAFSHYEEGAHGAAATGLMITIILGLA